MSATPEADNGPTLPSGASPGAEAALLSLSLPADEKAFAAWAVKEATSNPAAVLEALRARDLPPAEFHLPPGILALAAMIATPENTDEIDWSSIERAVLVSVYLDRLCGAHSS